MQVTSGASRFEFEQRVWIIGLIFGLGVAMSAVDSSHVADLLVHAVVPGVDLDSRAGQAALRAAFAAAAALVFAAAWLRTWPPPAHVGVEACLGRLRGFVRVHSADHT